MKRKKRVISIILSLVALTAASVFGYILIHASFSSNKEIEKKIAEPIRHGSSTQPDRLVIPSIGVDARVQHTGITTKGTMAVPTNYTDVGWYRLGPLPGESGSAVVAGHFDNGFGLPSVFRKLGDLKQGDHVYVKNEKDQIFDFKVTGRETYSYASSTATIFATSNSAHLNLITCDGDWNADAMMYSSRQVVFTDYVGIVESIPK